MKAINLLLVVGVLGVSVCGYFMLTGKDIITSLIRFICGASLIFGWIGLKNQKRVSEI